MVDEEDDDAVHHVPRRGLLLRRLQLVLRRPCRPEHVEQPVGECGEEETDDLRGGGHEDLDDAGMVAETERGPCLLESDV